MTTAIFSFFGIAIGALLQYFFTRHLDLQRSQREARAKAYMDYLQCVSESAHPAYSIFAVETRELRARLANAKCRICLHGSAKAIAAFAEFERLGATMNSVNQRDLFTRMVSIMRGDSASDLNVSANDLRILLFAEDHISVDGGCD